MSQNLIPIGFDCSVAATLRELNKRKCAYPFDWNIVNLNSVYNIIQSIDISNDEFSNFLEYNSIIFGNKSYTHKYENENVSTSLVELRPFFCKNKGILFVHDLKESEFKECKKIAIEKIRSKYIKRLKILKTALLSNEENIFVYKFDSIEYKNNIYNHWNNYFTEDIKKFLNYSENNNELLKKLCELTNSKLIIIK